MAPKSRPNTVMLSLDDEQRSFVEAEAARLRLPLATTIRLWITERMTSAVRENGKKGGRPNKTKVAQLLDECRNGLSLNNAAKLGYTHAQISAADKIITAALSGEEVE